MRLIELPLEEIERQSFCIGFEGEQNHTGIVFHCGTVFADHPSAVVTMAAQSPRGDLYPVSLSREENDLVWMVSASDCVSAGFGRYQLTFVNGQEILKSFIGSFIVMPSLVAAGDPPAPVSDWLQHAGQTLGLFETMTAEASSLEADQPATAELLDREGLKVLHIGVPAGQPGRDAAVDATLSVEGAAADAKAVGERKADRRDTVLDTTLSRGRKADSDVGTNSFAFGYDVTASGDFAHAEGGTTVASGAYAHTEGGGTKATADYSHAEGGGSTASANGAHAEGSGTTASSNSAHAEGGGTVASGETSHSEGAGSEASGIASHAEGSSTKATARCSHAEGGGWRNDRFRYQFTC